jgi:hypothetical protein
MDPNVSPSIEALGLHLRSGKHGLVFLRREVVEEVMGGIHLDAVLVDLIMEV